MRYLAVTRRTFWARYVRHVGLPVHSQPISGGVAVAADFGALLTRLLMRGELKQAGLRPGSV